MAESIKYTKAEIEKASYPDKPENNLVFSKIPLGRMQSANGRVYYQSNIEVGERTYIYSSTTILDKVLSKGIGFSMWLGNSPSYESAMEYGMKRARIGSMVHALCMYLLWGETIDTRDGFLIED